MEINLYVQPPLTISPPHHRPDTSPAVLQWPLLVSYPVTMGPVLSPAVLQ